MNDGTASRSATATTATSFAPPGSAQPWTSISPTAWLPSRPRASAAQANMFAVEMPDKAVIFTLLALELKVY